MYSVVLGCSRLLETAAVGAAVRRLEFLEEHIRQKMRVRKRVHCCTALSERPSHSHLLVAVIAVVVAVIAAAVAVVAALQILLQTTSRIS